jgi:hypothetical protein
MPKSEFRPIWHRISLDNPELTYGKRLSRFFTDDLGDACPGATVLLYEVEGGGDPLRGLTGLGCVKISMAELNGRLQYTDQLDWATFCFIQKPDEQTLQKLCGGISIAEAVSKSILTVRVIDDSYLDILTRDDQLRSRLTERYPSSRVESSPLDQMVFPK